MGSPMIRIEGSPANARGNSCGSGDTDQIITIVVERPHARQAMWLCRACIENQLIPSLATTWPPIVTTRIVGVMAPRP